MKKMLTTTAFLLYAILLLGQYTDITLKEAYLFKFASYIQNDLQAEDDWDQYFKQLWDKYYRAPGYMGPGAIIHSPLGMIATFEKVEMGLDPYKRYYETFPIGYLKQFYPENYTDNEYLSNEFAARRLLLEGKKKLMEDVQKLPFEKQRYLNATAALRKYDFKEKMFPVDLNIQFTGLTDLNYNLYLPFFFREDYKDQLANLKLQLSEEEGEALVKKLATTSVPFYNLNAKIVFTVHRKKATQIAYKHNVRKTSDNYFFFPWEYTLNHIDLELYKNDGQGNKEMVELLHRFTDFKQKGKVTTSTQSKTNEVKKAPDSYSFIKRFEGSKDRTYVDYVGTAENYEGSKNRVNRIQLRLNYSYYKDHSDYEFRELKPDNLFGFFYFELANKSNRVAWQRLYTKKPLINQNGYKVTVGANPQSKAIQKAGYKNGSLTMLFMEDHSISLLLYDEKGNPQFLTTLRPLDKNLDPPFTRK
ncbi:MAG: hypothetical protein AAFO07_05865 [Bacteroidota bacterium]